jgi:hypothetical protein
MHVTGELRETSTCAQARQMAVGVIASHFDVVVTALPARLALDFPHRLGMLVLRTNIAEACNRAIGLSSLRRVEKHPQKMFRGRRNRMHSRCVVRGFATADPESSDACPALRRLEATITKSIVMEKRNRLT